LLKGILMILIAIRSFFVNHKDEWLLLMLLKLFMI
jgi:hypothetical protein